jgi:uncharacterized protein DUF4411
MSGGSSRYLLDANVFIQAKDQYYGFVFCPGFWSSLIAQHTKSRVSSIDKIKDELKGDPTLGTWIREDVPPTFFKQSKDVTVIKALADMNKWVASHALFTPAAKTEFAASADGWLIAYAYVNGLTVVTQETHQPDARNRVKIPNVCIEFGVDCVNTFEMLTDLGVKLIRSTKR